jgi:hypothetical protein
LAKVPLETFAKSFFSHILSHGRLFADTVAGTVQTPVFLFAPKVRPSFMTLYTHTHSNHFRFPIKPVAPSRPVSRTGTLSPAELRRIVADMID